MASTFNCDFDKGIAKMVRLTKQVERKDKLMKLIGEALVSSTKQRMVDGENPQGEKHIKTLRGETPLVHKSRLMKSVTAKVLGDDVFIGSNLEYARIHQLGGVIEPKKKKALRFQLPNGRWVIAKKVTIPKREYLGVSKEDEEEIKEMIRIFIEDAVKG